MKAKIVFSSTGRTERYILLHTTVCTMSYAKCSHWCSFGLFNWLYSSTWYGIRYTRLHVGVQTIIFDQYPATRCVACLYVVSSDFPIYRYQSLIDCTRASRLSSENIWSTFSACLSQIASTRSASLPRSLTLTLRFMNFHAQVNVSIVVSWDRYLPRTWDEGRKVVLWTYGKCDLRKWADVKMWRYSSKLRT